MKLTPAQVKIVRQATGFTPLTEEQASESGLYNYFGDDTFYLDDKGVHVFEEVEIESEVMTGKRR